MDDRLLLACVQSTPLDDAALSAATGLTPALLAQRLAQLARAGVALQRDPLGRWQLAAGLDLHQPQHLARLLAPATRQALSALDVLWQVDSTNSELLRRPLPARGITALLAETQTAGRGRRGRHWVSPLARHLYLSLGCRFEAGIAAMAGLSLVVGVVVAEVLRGQGLAVVGVKWPNDLLLDGHKLGGVLVESAGAARGPALAVIGIGLNVHSGAQAAIDQPWTALDRHGERPPSRDVLAAALLDALVPALALFMQQGLAPFLPRYAAVDLLAGQPLWVHDGDGRHPAQAIGLAANGALRVVEATGERQLHAGEVSVRTQ